MTCLLPQQLYMLSKVTTNCQVGYEQNCLWLVTEGVGGRTIIALRDEVGRTQLTLKWLAFYITDFMNFQSRLRDLLNQQDVRYPSDFIQGNQKCQNYKHLGRLVTEERTLLITASDFEDVSGRLIFYDKKRMLWCIDCDGWRSCSFKELRTIEAVWA